MRKTQYAIFIADLSGYLTDWDTGCNGFCVSSDIRDAKVFENNDAVMTEIKVFKKTYNNVLKRKIRDYI